MGRLRKWKPGDRGYIAAGTRDSFGFTFAKPIDVTVISATANLVKVTTKDGTDGTVYYCAPKDLHTRKAQAKRDPAKHVATEEIKKTAEKMAEERMETIMTEIQEKETTAKEADKLPSFGSICRRFYMLAGIGNRAVENDEEQQDTDWVISACERQLFEEIKKGCVWGDVR